MKLSIFFVFVELSTYAKDLNVTLNTSTEEIQNLLKSSTQTNYTEIWSFVRKKGACSKENYYLLEGNCSNCSSSISELGELNQCKNCKSIINSGEYDWVLSEITQIEEWKPDNKNDVNLKEYAKVTDIDSFHKAKVLVLWSGASSPSSEPVHQRHILHLSIRVGTEKKSGLSENSCETCGAPLPESDSLTCEYCGDSVPKTVADWLLDRIEVLNHY